MAARIRPASQDDVPWISGWTADTFEWGDYVPERLPQWLAEPDSAVLVTVDAEDRPTAVAHVLMLSPTEGWLEGARVHPDHRRGGLGSALNHAGVEWAAERGARVVRLATETANVAARSQVEALGYREVSRWIYAELDVPPHHVASDRSRLRPAPSSDAEAAWLFWVASDLAREGRELIGHGWRWRSARPDDVTGLGELHQSPAGWLALDQPEDDWIRVHWMVTTSEDILVLLDGLIALASERGVTDLDVMLPELPWTTEAMRRSGSEPTTLVVYAKAVKGTFR